MTWFRSHHARFMGDTREKLSRFFTSSPQRLLSLAIRSSDPFISSCLGEAGVVLDPALHQLGVGQDAGQRIVDLVRDHGGHLADGRHLLHVQHVLMRLLQLARLLFDAVLQGMRPGRDLGLRHLQPTAHVVERLGQLTRLRRCD